MNPLRNIGKRIEGPRILGMTEYHLNTYNNTYQTKSVTLFKVERRDSSTLIPFVRENVEKGYNIWSDQWGEYSRVTTEIPGLYHETVNHSFEFVATNGAHTQTIKRVWEKLKLKLMKI
ncbi:hypothetical protein RF11_13311 [Thelohanellus kitauei]|uniref:ISXO2-like transposase domain-containing protein n=1 Tax=Thelohanellus kitauei TaxID=669202 RepID=A0A0C2J993_THEKT|nr:hypothetical protein RF11_13311 [Thelohanellus kitauei]